MPDILRYIGGAIRWAWRLRCLLQREKRTAGEDVGVSLDTLKKLFEQQLAKETNPEKRQALEDKLEELMAAERGYYMARLKSALERSDLPPYDALVANGERVLEPENKAKLIEAVTRLDLLPPPPTADDFIASGIAKYALGRYEEALADYTEALVLRPDYVEALNNRGNTYLSMERYEEALADYNNALELKPDEPAILTNRGTTYAKLERYEEALADFDRAIQLSPDYAEVLYNMACLFSLWRKPDDAISYLEKAIHLDAKWREEATKESDFHNIRDDPRFRKLVEGA